MKKFLLLALLLVGFGMMNAQSMKMVVDKRGNVVGRYVETDRNVYYISVQDVSSVPKRGHRIVTFSAAKGQGVVFYDQSRTGNLNVKALILKPLSQDPDIAVVSVQVHKIRIEIKYLHVHASSLLVTMERIFSLSEKHVMT